MKLETLATACIALITVTGCDVLGDGIGPEGGTVVSDDGRLTLDIPEGALHEPVEITIEEVDALPEDAIGPSYRVEPVGTVFNGPVHVLYNYGARGMEIDHDDVALVALREHEWTKLPDRRVYADEGIVSASALYLSTFGVVLADQS